MQLMSRPRFKAYRQLDRMDCGAACLRMVAKHYGRHFSVQSLRARTRIGKEGVSLLGMSRAAEDIGFRTRAVRLPLERLSEGVPLPFIAHWKQNHFVVVYAVVKGKVYIADPATGKETLQEDEFKAGWARGQVGGSPAGIALLLEPTPAFYERDQESSELNLRYLWHYLRGNGKYVFQVLLGLAVGSLLQLILPFLTQVVVDYGIANRDIGFIYLILAAQLALFTGRTAVNFIRDRILFHVGQRINIALISDFISKLLRLPISFFETRTVGDILQRVQDHQRVEQFLTVATLSAAFSMFSLVVFGVVLAIYDFIIFAIFTTGTVVYILYVNVFMPRRRELDQQRFQHTAENQSVLIELLNGMQEIKLANAEQQRRWVWEGVQVQLFRVGLRSLNLQQSQEGGASFINETKNIVITFWAAKLVIDGSLTLGMLLAVQYIVGQLNGPVTQLVSFIRTTQDARMSLERLGEVHAAPNEEDPERVLAAQPSGGLWLTGVSFRYPGANEALVLSDLDMEVPEGKVTAVVGVSGSGKTTLLKLLLKFYAPTEGSIRLGGTDLATLSTPEWRARCGVVLQEGYIFADTVAQNVALSSEVVDEERLVEAVRLACIRDFIESLPLAYNTRVGKDGVGLSKGQQQRLLIARAIYKDPKYLFFDEATSALDANNERAIMDNLKRFYAGRTVLIIAHRLSTVRDSDQIVVVDEGRIVECGTHPDLVAQRGSYFMLVKNQLELGR